MKTKETTIDINPKDLNFVIFMQHVAAARNVSVEKRYWALAQDVVAVIEGEKPTHSKELI